MRNPLDPPPRTAPQAPAAAALSQAGAALCPACGLCCNGVLFGSVRLDDQDNLDVFRKHQFEPQRLADGWGILQPCRACRERECAIYPDRPRQCREVVCRLLDRLAHGQTDRAVALRTIQETRRLAARVESLLVRLGHTETSLSLSRRFRRCVANPPEESSEHLETRAELMLAVQALTGRLRDEFYPDP